MKNLKLKQFARLRRQSYRAATITLLLVIFSALLFVGPSASTADQTDSNQPASQGRPITPAGSLLPDMQTKQTAIGALPVKFVRSPDHDGPDGAGRYLIAVNSGFGLQFDAASNRAQQSLSVIDLKQSAVIQNIYFPKPQSANVGAVFAPRAESDGSFPLYISGGFENKIWVFSFRSGDAAPISPASPGPDTTVKAPFIDLAKLMTVESVADYNDNKPPFYPTGIDISPDGNTLYAANNLDDSLAIISNLRGAKHEVKRVDLHHEANTAGKFVYPYEVVALPDTSGKQTAKVYVSCWNQDAIAVVDPRRSAPLLTSIAVARHPSAMLLNTARTRLYAVNSNADSVSVIDTAADKEIERINVRLAENNLTGNSPESLSLSADGGTLYVANAHSNSVAVVSLSNRSRGNGQEESADRSIVRGFIPTGQYPSAVASVGNSIFIGNGKGTGVENSSTIVNNSGRVPNAPNERFPSGKGTHAMKAGGQYSLSIVAGNYSLVATPDERTLAGYTQQVMRNNYLLDAAPRTKLFNGPTPIKHVIYIIRENRTYDQVFGDLERSGNGQPADGDASLAIFGAGQAAMRGSNQATAQNITPNARALALRFGLLDRFFVNSEASPDGHSWATAAFSNDYVDKAYRWQYSGRGRTYDYEGFNRLPSFQEGGGSPAMFAGATDAKGVVKYLSRYVPYLNDSRDVAESASLYLWDAAARAGLSYRNYGEFVASVTADEVASLKLKRKKTYPDLSPTVEILPTKKSLEGHSSPTYRNFDLYTPDAISTDSYRTAKETKDNFDPAITRQQAEARFRGTSRLGEWLEEFRAYVAERQANQPDRLPNLSIVRFSNDHTAGLSPGLPSPQFSVADNDYAVGRLVEAVSNSPYWKETAIFVLEDDAQDGPDHVDAHRSPALVISAYNRPGALVHDFHNTVSLIRTIELLLGIEPMNQLDATAIPINIFRDEADLRPYKAVLPEVALDNLMNPPAKNRTARYWLRRTEELDLAHADMADPRTLNEIIWYSVRGANQPMPQLAHLPVFDAMRQGIREDEENERREELSKVDK